MASAPFWSKPNAWTPWALAATTPEQRGQLRAIALAAGLILTHIGGKSPRGPWTVELIDTQGKRWRHESAGPLFGVIQAALERARVAPETELEKAAAYGDR